MPPDPLLSAPQSIPFRQQDATADSTVATDSTAADSTVADSLFADMTPIESLLEPVVWQGLGLGLARIVLIIVMAFFVAKIVDRVVGRSVRRYDDLPPLDPSRQRALTISNLISSTVQYVIWPVAVIMILSELKVDVAALIATAGIAGLAVGFGAQTLVKDVISGVFLLFDNTLAIGDRVRINNDYGLVEHIGLRLIKVRKFDGEVLMVPAGELRIFGNTSIGYMRAIVDVGVGYSSDIRQVLEILNGVTQGWVKENPDILVGQEPQVHAILGFADSALMARVVIAMLPGEQFRAEREIRIAVKQAFDEAGIEIPFPQRTVHVRNDER